MQFVLFGFFLSLAVYTSFLMVSFTCVLLILRYEIGTTPLDRQVF